MNNRAKDFILDILTWMFFALPFIATVLVLWPLIARDWAYVVEWWWQ